MKAQNYKVIKHPDLEVLENKVNKLLEEGWELLGSCQYADMIYLQTMVLP